MEFLGLRKDFLFAMRLLEEGAVMYEPKNRRPDSLPILQIEVEHADGVAKTNPNGIALSAMWGMRGEPIALPKGVLVEGTNLFDPTYLKPLRDVKSIISGLPAVIYRAEDYELALTPSELFRFMKHALLPAEYFALRDYVGMIHEIHDDFYDVETGAAFQPMDEASYEKDMGWG